MGKSYLKKKESLLEEMNENKRCCSDCKTTQTPLWRSGPSGPKSLCNACGIRYRKKGIFSVSLSKGPKRDKREKKYGSISSNGSTKKTAAAAATTTTTKTASTAKRTVGGGGDRVLSESLKVRLVAVGKEVFLQGSPSAAVKKKRKYQRRRELGEVEQAAVCLVALSCDSVFALRGKNLKI